MREKIEDDVEDLTPEMFEKSLKELMAKHGKKYEFITKAACTVFIVQTSLETGRDTNKVDQVHPAPAVQGQGGLPGVDEPEEHPPEGGHSQALQSHCHQRGKGGINGKHEQISNWNKKRTQGCRTYLHNEKCNAIFRTEQQAVNN